MSVEMEDVRALLDPDEPDYGAVAALGEEALPHLAALTGVDDPMLASKAAYAASLVGGADAATVVARAADSAEPMVRVAAAAGAANLSTELASDLLATLVADSDPGVRKVARASVPDDASDALTARLQELPEDEADDEADHGAGEPLITDGLMPGEEARPSSMPGESTGLMPGESPDRGASGGMA